MPASVTQEPDGVIFDILDTSGVFPWGRAEADVRAYDPRMVQDMDDLISGVSRPSLQWLRIESGGPRNAGARVSLEFRGGLSPLTFENASAELSLRNGRLRAVLSMQIIWYAPFGSLQGAHQRSFRPQDLAKFLRADPTCAGDLDASASVPRMLLPSGSLAEGEGYVIGTPWGRAYGIDYRRQLLPTSTAEMIKQLNRGVQEARRLSDEGIEYFALFAKNRCEGRDGPVPEPMSAIGRRRRRSDVL